MIIMNFCSLLYMRYFDNFSVMYFYEEYFDFFKLKDYFECLLGKKTEISYFLIIREILYFYKL